MTASTLGAHKYLYHPATLLCAGAVGFALGLGANFGRNVEQRGVSLMQLTHSSSKQAFQKEDVIHPAMPAPSPAWMVKVGEFREDIEKHIPMEENQLFLRLRDQIGKDGKAHATRMMNKAGLAAA